MKKAQETIIQRMLKVNRNSNWFVMNDKIPLGRNSYNDRKMNGLPVCSKFDSSSNRNFHWVCMNYKRNGVITILGSSGVGKTVTAKKIFAWYLLPGYFGGKYKRPGVIFDYQGDDHRLIKHPNGYLGNKPFPLIRDVEFPTGFNNLINFTPMYLKDDCFFKDEFFGFTLSDFKYEDWYSLRIQEASLETLQEIIKKNKKFAKDPQEFYEHFKHIQTKAKDIGRSVLVVEENMSELQKSHLRKLLRELVDENVLVKKEFKKNFIQLLYENNILNFNFHEDERFSPFYMSPIARALYTNARNNTRKYGNKYLNPVLLLEEAQIPLDRKDINLSSGANKWITKYLKQGNKFQNLVILLTQAITEVNKTVRNHAVKQEVILGNPTNSDLKYFSMMWSRNVIDVIKTLRWEDRELALVHSGGNYVETFFSNNSMTQIHLR